MLIIIIQNVCGIVGFTGSSQSTILEKMTESIHHRGPDDAAYMVSKDFSVGYRRLAIIDLSENIYPIQNETETIDLVLNGEIYNYQELRKELIEKGHTFVTQSDSETIVHGYEEWGHAVVDKLRGMFVFVLHDKQKDELFIARDRLGIKPLYYSLFDGRIIFGSEIKGLFSGFGISREPNSTVVQKFLITRVHDDTEETFFKDVKRLMPGHYMIITNESDSGFPRYIINKYWNPDLNKEFSSKKSDDEYAHEFKEVFSEAVGLHLIADVPVGVTLSGGLDSSGITALSKQKYDEMYPNANQEIIAFSAVHPGETIDETEYIDSVVNATGIKSVKITPHVDDFWTDLDTWIYMQEEPVISGAPYAYYTVMREASKHVTVLLSGQGGDELLAGYVPYFMTYLKSALDQKHIWAAIRESWMGKDLYFKYFVELLKARRQDPTKQINIRKMMERDSFVMPEKTPYSRNLNERLFTDVTSTTTPCLLRYEDKNSMAHSLESRVPFFDHKVVEYIFNLPIDQKIKFGWSRYVYRNAMKGIIPDKNRLRRSKIGFTNPEWEWIERRADKFREIFSSQSFKQRSFWNADEVLNQFEKALTKEISGDILFFWRAFSVEMWMRKYVD